MIFFGLWITWGVFHVMVILEQTGRFLWLSQHTYDFDSEFTWATNRADIARNKWLIWTNHTLLSWIRMVFSHFQIGHPTDTRAPKRVFWYVGQQIIQIGCCFKPMVFKHLVRRIYRGEKDDEQESVGNCVEFEGKSVGVQRSQFSTWKKPRKHLSRRTLGTTPRWNREKRRRRSRRKSPTSPKKKRKNRSPEEDCGGCLEIQTIQPLSRLSQMFPATLSPQQS